MKGCDASKAERKIVNSQFDMPVNSHLVFPNQSSIIFYSFRMTIYSACFRIGFQDVIYDL